MDQDLYLSNFAINSQAATIDTIKREEGLHFSRGIRAAELIIAEKSNVLRQNYRFAKEQERKNTLHKIWVKSLIVAYKVFRFIPVLSILVKHEIERKEELLEDYEKSKSHFVSLIRDANLELATAQQELERIIERHPTIKDLSYLQREQYFSSFALIEKMSVNLGAALWAAEHNLPEHIGKMIFEMSPDDRLSVLKRSAEIKNGVYLDNNAIELAMSIIRMDAQSRHNLSQQISQYKQIKEGNKNGHQG